MPQHSFSSELHKCGSIYSWEVELTVLEVKGQYHRVERLNRGEVQTYTMGTIYEVLCLV